MTAALTLRCHICGSRLGPLEPAAVSTGHAEVCADGYACATRANRQRAGKARFAVVTEVSAGENESGASVGHPCRCTRDGPFAGLHLSTCPLAQLGTPVTKEQQ